jgi:hypothetical protein
VTVADANSLDRSGGGAANASRRPDARDERFTNNAEANRCLSYEYHAPYKLR